MARFPDLVVHADWSASPKKRWAARATIDAGQVSATAPRQVAGEAVESLALPPAGVGTTTLVGFDFVIGLPRAYAARVDVDSFRALLPQLGHGRWEEFFDVARTPEDIAVHRPFYPHRPGGSSPSHLWGALGIARDEGLRRCERPTRHRPGASPLFWTLGGKQVGKGTIAGWREVLQPLVAQRDDVRLWPFDGSLEDLLGQPGVVLAETYPAECFHHLGVAFRGASKRDREARARQAGALLAWAARHGVELDADLRAAIAEGFPAGGDDAFDAVAGLFGMLDVVLGTRPAGAPADDPAVTSVEGWILGLDPAGLAPPAGTPQVVARPPRGATFVVARNPDVRSKLPYLLRIPVDGGPLLLKSREPWPRTARVYCHRVDGWPEGAEILEEVAVASCRQRGRAVDLVLDRARENRSQFVFVSQQGREAIFWQTARTARQARPGVRIPTRRASRWDTLEIVADTRERYAYRFASQQAEVERRALRVGDYAVERDGETVACVERKSVADLAASLVDGKLAFAMAELASLGRGAVVVEGAYADVFKLEHVQPGFVADLLARVQVRYPGVPIVFAGTRKLAEEWTFRFLGAALVEASPDDTPQ